MHNAGMMSSDRYRELTRYRNYFLCAQHDHKKYSWDGAQAPGNDIDAYQMDTGTMSPPQVDDNAPPIRFRRPSTPYNIGRVVVETFTDLLFDEDRAPKIVCKSDKEWQQWLRDVVDRCHFWPTFTMFRDYGGSCGSAVVTLHFVKGRPCLTVIDSRYCTPVLDDECCVKSLTIQYIYASEEEVIETDSSGRKFKTQETIRRWYRREIDSMSDRLYDNPKCDDNGGSPDFKLKRVVEHGIGRCPATWVRNLPDGTGIDGVADYFGATDLFDEVDMLASQGSRGTKYNSDPTLHIGTGNELEHVRTGSLDLIKTEAAGVVKLVELNGQGTVVCMGVVENLRQAALVICRCILDKPQANDRDRVTATEISKSELQMFAKANRLRKEYGRAIIDMLTIIATACSKFKDSHELVDGEIVKTIIDPRFITPSGIELMDKIELRWGRYINVSPFELKTMIESLAIALKAHVIDLETAVEMLCAYLPYKDTDELVVLIKKEIKEERAQELALVTAQTAQRTASFGDKTKAT